MPSVESFHAPCMLKARYVGFENEYEYCSRFNFEDNQETLVTLGTQDTDRRQSRDTGNIGYTRHRPKTIKRHW